jgi:hypothetical protein
VFYVSAIVLLHRFMFMYEDVLNVCMFDRLPYVRVGREVSQVIIGYYKPSQSQATYDNNDNYRQCIVYSPYSMYVCLLSISESFHFHHIFLYWGLSTTCTYTYTPYRHFLVYVACRCSSIADSYNSRIKVGYIG